MKKRMFIMGILSMMLVFGVLLFIGCSDDSDDSGGGANPFLGTWTGTAKIGEDSASATVINTDSGWIFSCPEIDMNETGTYTRSGNTATLSQSGTTFGTASVSGNTLTVSITSGSYSGGSGSFTKR